MTGDGKKDGVRMRKMVLEAKGLTKYYGKKPALVDFSYDFRPGIYGLLGPNGAGKSTLMGS